MDMNMANGAEKIARERMERLTLEKNFPHALPGVWWPHEHITRWCQDHCKGRWHMGWTEIRFALQEDAVAFSLVWQ